MKTVQSIPRPMNTPLIRDVSAYQNFRLTKVTPEAQALIGDVVKKAASHIARRMPRVIRCFECYLQITDGPVLGARETWVANIRVLESFIGALNSPAFIQAKGSTRAAYVQVGMYLLTTLGGQTVDKNVSTGPRSSLVMQFTERFQTLQLNESAVILWRAWPVTPLSGKVISLPLYGVYEAHGAAIAQSLHDACATYVATRRIDRIPGFKELADYLSGLPSFNFSTYQSPDSSSLLWENFYQFYKDSRAGKCKPQTILNDWCTFCSFAQSALIGPGLISPPAGGMPGPLAEDIFSTEDNKALAKLLLPVPPELGTYQALAFLREEMPKTLHIIKKWATDEAESLYNRAKARRHAARLGTARVRPEDAEGKSNPRSLMNRENPTFYENACATYERYGHISRQDYENPAGIFPDNLELVSHELGLPSAGTLLAHATLLVHEHPEIIPSFLENLRLWNSSGKLTGLVRLGKVTYLIGKKYRAHGKHVIKQIQLTKTSRRLIVEILRITSNLRKYLKDRGDPNWRYLFLSCDKGFDYPTRLTRFSPLTSGPGPRERLANAFYQAGAPSIAYVHTLAKQFSLRSVRHTRAITIFLETHSEVEMAKALGHARRSRALNSYLPKALAAFLRVRWIRAFQTRIIVHTTRNSPHQLIASGLCDTHALNMFMEQHPFPDIDQLSHSYDEGSVAATDSDIKNGTFVINGSVGNLTVLTNIIRAVDEANQPMNANAKYWASLSKHVIEYIKSQSGRQPSLAKAIYEAESNSRILDLSLVIYA
ncbi:hypothetical protein SAMN05216466_10526 [Paraburkholderia phenazinium]|uniref:Uncharacterized protein n=1 Tax=Paraburkholderia phenazinium TaxID=60549 RepID=A0A1G7WS28_9BURK|nr:hypothetical protein [Paraburkholderia phenazinium]SDG74775.1 hypothetical protein SAMN05216466_10526 [Paraburkholderia phenazinium]